MKVGIITIVDNNNFGNRLQNYALQHTLNKFDVDVYTMLNDSIRNNKKKYLFRCIKNFFRSDYQYTFSDNLGRKENFYEFNKYIKFSRFRLNPFFELSKIDVYIVGSDQVWNPSIGRLSDVDLVSFKTIAKKISYAASIAIKNVSNSDSKKIAKYLSKFDYISVRENEGKKVLDTIIYNNNIQVLIDPTLLLTTEEWDIVSKKPKMLFNKKYILNYFLGDLSYERKYEIERIALENNCEIINIMDKNSPFYECGPSEFLYLEKNAFLICTDSFHSSVFAFIYDRPFIVFDREQKDVSNMGSRLDTLISKFNLKNRKFEGKITEENLKHDYSEAYKILEVERQKSKDFLERALDIKK